MKEIESDGGGVMGCGIAAQAANRIPELPQILGECIKKGGWRAIYHLAPHILSFPVKRDWGIYDGHNVVRHMERRFKVGDSVPGWALKAETGIIAQSLLALEIWYKHVTWPCVVLPRPGCGAGGLDWETQVKPLCEAMGNWLQVIHLPGVK